MTPPSVTETPKTSVDRALSALCNTVAQFGIAMLIVFAVLTALDGLTRWLFNWPLEFVRDLGGVWIAVGISCCFPIAFLDGRNIVMDLAESFVSSAANRFLDVLSSLVVAVFLFLFAYQFWHYAHKLQNAGEMSMTLEIPTAPFWYAVDANLWLTLFVQLFLVSRAVRRLAMLESPADRGHN